MSDFSKEYQSLLSVEWINSTRGKEYIRQNHYTGTCHNGPMTVGLFLEGRLIGVCAFATPISEDVRAYFWGSENVNRVTELHRLFIEDGTPTNTESWFIARSLKLLKDRKPGLWGVVSFADTTEGHTGVIYRATNALYMGTTGHRERFYEDSAGRIHHSRQSGRHVTPEEAKERDWVKVYREVKHRYLFLLPDSRTHRKSLLRNLQREVKDYRGHHDG